MHIKWLELSNYKSFRKKSRIEFAPGMNLIVGKNNSGKSTILEGLSMRLGHHPHKSLTAQPTFGYPVDPWCVAGIQIEFSGAELKPALLRGNGQYTFVTTGGLDPTGTRCHQELAGILSADTLRAVGTLHRNKDVSQWQSYDPPVPFGHEGPVGRGHVASFTVRPNANLSDFVFVHSQPISPERDSSCVFVQLLHSSVYVFEAERRAAGPCRFGRATVLAPDAENLAEVLNNLRENPARFSNYQGLVTQVFPDIKGLTVSHAPGSDMLEVRLWLAPIETERTDLTISLTECGTGIGQVLAILYVVTSSPSGSVIAIDEPNSFLHPEASRTLIRILKKHSRHQYIISTHSPEVISEAASAALIAVLHDGTESEISHCTGEPVEHAMRALRLVGARLSDVFGYDRILWVEGPSDAIVLEKLVRHWSPDDQTIAVRPVRSTADFRKNTIDRTVEIYAQLSHAKALVPPALGFIFDREDRSDRDVADAERRQDVEIRFLDRTMMENYFLDADVLAAFLSGLDSVPGAAISEKQVADWQSTQFSGDRSDWVRSCHGKHVIQGLIEHFFESKYVYIEAKHLPELAEIQLQLDESRLSPLRELLARIGVGRA